MKISDRKLTRLKQLLRPMKRVIVAYSGGLDSTFLLYISASLLGKRNVIAVTASSESYPKSEERLAKGVAKGLSVRHKIIRTSELKIKRFTENPVERCYYCKRELFGRLRQMAKDEGFGFVLDGSNYDDLKDLRYGMRAAKELGIRSPLLEAGLGKKELRFFSKKAGLPTWNKPPLACLASRFPSGQRITEAKLRIVGEAEAFLRKMGFRQVRVRCHKDIARIEVGADEIEAFMHKAVRKKAAKKLSSLGFAYAALDLTGYRLSHRPRGSMR